MGTDNKFPTEVIDLPSKGWYYDQNSVLASGQIELKYLTAKEEDILTSRNLIQKGVVLDRLLQALIVDKNIDYSQLLTGDKNGILVATRILGYGKEYKVNITCSSCGQLQSNVVDLTALVEKDIKEPTEKGKNEFTFMLPILKKVVIFKLLTHKDEEDIIKEIEMSKKLGSDIDTTLSTRLKYIITSVDGNATEAAVRAFVDNDFLARDARAFRDYYASVNPDIDLSFDFGCENCGEHRRVEMPIGIDFFWPDTGV